MEMSAGTLPLVNACLNGLSGLLLVAGLVLVRRRLLVAHRACMLSAFGVSVVFLALYLYHKIVVVKGVNTPFPGPATLRPWYRAMLFSHIVLAIAVVPLALVTIHRGLRERFDQHRRIARWTWPVWMYVSVTGVAVYLALYVVWAR
jgi:putative membrane protein